MRPIYEQEQDRTAEWEIAHRVAYNWNVVPYKLSMAYGLDFALARDRGIKAIIETKYRNWHFNQGDGFRISLLKALKAVEISATVGVPCFMVIRFSGGDIYWSRFKPMEGCIIAGRIDRPDAADIEPHIVVPWADFERL